MFGLPTLLSRENPDAMMTWTPPPMSVHDTGNKDSSTYELFFVAPFDAWH